MARNVDTTIYEHIEETVDNITGEVTLTEKRAIVKQAKTPEFIMMFTEGAPFLAGAKLTGSQTAVLFMLLHKFVLPTDNVLLLTAYTRQTISNEMKIAKNTVDSAILTLIEKNIILVKKEMGKVYYLNPNIFGRGNWNDIKKLRYQTSVEYDFENKNINETRATTFGYGDVDKNNIDIVGTEENISDNGKLIEQKVIIEDKVIEENKGDYSIVTLNEVPEKHIQDIEQENNIIAFEIEQNRLKNAELDLKLLEAQNKKIELEIENKKIDLEILKMKSRENKQASLFEE